MRLILILTCTLLLFAFWSCESTEDAEDDFTNFELIQPVLETNTSAGAGKPISAQTLFDNMNDGNASNDYFVLSVRSAETYALGHIPGAINIYWRDVGNPTNLALLPTDQPILVYCYTGHTGQAVTTALVNLGYDAVNLKFGFMSWSKDATARVQSPFVEDVDGHDYTTETTATAGGDFALAEPEWISSQDAEEIIAAAADDCLTNRAPVTKAADLFANLNDGDATNDPQVVSVRSADTYAIGHIPGAINIYWKDIAKVESLKMIDPSKPVVVYCYTGHTGQIASTVLAILGYDATNMKHGMMSWSRDAAVRVQSPFTEDVDSHEFPITTGTNP
ncbi:MAG: rhodanese-like domain-containing protein [Candidatus Marinimicrobia bacterium]|nr:rhodanese-like domain-containing protein [FCB group bacterium]MBL7026193.1 rhodanese-like domain-containing protein [Candidatus Neomarinimicrobiota bacterium]